VKGAKLLKGSSACNDPNPPLPELVRQAKEYVKSEKKKLLKELKQPVHIDLKKERISLRSAWIKVGEVSPMKAAHKILESVDQGLAETVERQAGMAICSRIDITAEEKRQNEAMLMDVDRIVDGVRGEINPKRRQKR
jgi:hypothetical protein